MSDCVHIAWAHAGAHTHTCEGKVAGSCVTGIHCRLNLLKCLSKVSNVVLLACLDQCSKNFSDLNTDLISSFIHMKGEEIAIHFWFFHFHEPLGPQLGKNKAPILVSKAKDQLSGAQQVGEAS